MFPEHQNCAKQRAQTYTRTRPDMQRMLQIPEQVFLPLKMQEFAPYMRARFAAGRTTAFPLLVRHSCHATSIGAAIAMDE
jgi:hypothetical protein